MLGPRARAREEPVGRLQRDVRYLLTMNFRQPSHEFTFNVSIDLLF
jgi:hypothetical protein